MTFFSSRSTKLYAVLLICAALILPVFSLYVWQQQSYTHTAFVVLNSTETSNGYLSVGLKQVACGFSIVGATFSASEVYIPIQRFGPETLNYGDTISLTFGNITPSSTLTNVNVYLLVVKDPVTITTEHLFGFPIKQTCYGGHQDIYRLNSNTVYIEINVGIISVNSTGGASN